MKLFITAISILLFSGIRVFCQIEDVPPDVVSHKDPAFPINRDTTIYLWVDTMPQYPGGQEALKRFIAEEVSKTELPTIECALQGAVYIRFVVRFDGTVGRIEVRRGIDPMLDSVAVDIIKKLPRFEPGIKNGKPVNVWIIVPVRFKL